MTETALLAQALAAVDVADLPAARRLLAQLDRHQEHLAENDAIRVYVEGSLRLAEDDPQAALQLVGAYSDQPRGRPVDLHWGWSHPASTTAAEPRATGQDAHPERPSRHASRLPGLDFPGTSKGEAMLVAFSVAPSGDGPKGQQNPDASVHDAVAAAVRIVRESGLPNRTDSMFTTIEGSWDECMDVVRRCTEAVGEYGNRVSLVLKADIRPGHTGEITGKLDRLEQALQQQ